MPFEPPELRYALDALAPHISTETLQYHHGKHHKKYVETLNKLVEGTEYADMPLEEVVRKAPPAKIYNNVSRSGRPFAGVFHGDEHDGGEAPQRNVPRRDDRRAQRGGLLLKRRLASRRVESAAGAAEDRRPEDQGDQLCGWGTHRNDSIQ